MTELEQITALHVKRERHTLTSTPMTFGDKVKYWRLRRGYQVAARFARRAGVSAQYLHDLENGDYADPRISTVRKFARALKISLDELVDVDLLLAQRENNSAESDPACQGDALDSSYQPDTRAGESVPERMPPAGDTDAPLVVVNPSLRRSDYALQPPASGAIADVVKFLADISTRAADLALRITQNGDAGEQAPAPNHPEPKARHGH